MAVKQFTLDNGTAVAIYKRRSSRNLRLSISHDGLVRVSIPVWAPYRAGLEFARSRMDWIITQQPVREALKDGQAVGKAHHLHFLSSPNLTKPISRITGNTIQVQHPSGLSIEHTEVQAKARQASLRALRKQAEELLPQRLKALANKHGFKYQKVTIKKMKSRWGSCDQHANLTLNLYLMQLPWELIDYVLIHELVHTKLLKHGPEFWKAVELIEPKTKQLRLQIRKHRPVLYALDD